MAEYDPANMDWLPQGSAMSNIIEDWRQRREHQMRAVLSGSTQVNASLSVDVADLLHVSDSAIAEAQPPAAAYPDVLLQATVVHFGDRTNEGQLIAGVSIPWFEIIRT